MGTCQSKVFYLFDGDAKYSMEEADSIKYDLRFHRFLMVFQKVHLFLLRWCMFYKYKNGLVNQINRILCILLK